MSNPIKPAMSREAWEARQARKLPVYATISESHWANYVYHVALYNDELPDEHPNKLTREDVTALRAMLALDPHDRADHDGDGYHDPRQSAAMQRALSGIERVAAKLAALLPPE